jgi:hypothetical protein
MLLSFASPKESNQRKGDRKRQPQPVFPPATQAFTRHQTGRGSHLFRDAHARLP